MVNPEPQREPFREPADGYNPDITPRRPGEEPPRAGEVRGPFPSYERQRKTSWKATASLILAIAGLFVLPIILPVLAIILGWMGLSEIGRRPEVTGRGLAIAGIVIGAIALIIGIIGLVVAASYNWFTIYLY